METRVISCWQFYLLTINFSLGTTFFVMVPNLIKHGGQDAWLIPWWAGTFGVLFALLWISLLRCYPGESLVQIPLLALGRPLGTVIAMLYFLYFCILAGWVLRNLSDFMNVTLMPETPKSVFHLMFLIVACYAVANGVETVTRINQIVTPFLFFPFWFVLFLATVNWDWDRFQPVLASDIWTNMIRFHSFLGFPYMETIALTTAYPFVRKGAGRAFLLGIVTATLSLSIAVFMIIGLLGVERAARIAFPVYTIVQEIAIGEVIINIHSIISVVWLILIFIKLLVLVYGAYECLHKVLQPKTKWPHFVALTLLLSAIAQTIYENPIQNGEWSEKYTFAYDSFFCIFIPFLLMAATWLKQGFRNRRKRRTA